MDRRRLARAALGTLAALVGAALIWRFLLFPIWLEHRQLAPLKLGDARDPAVIAHAHEIANDPATAALAAQLPRRNWEFPGAGGAAPSPPPSPNPGAAVGSPPSPPPGLPPGPPRPPLPPPPTLGPDSFAPPPPTQIGPAPAPPR